MPDRKLHICIVTGDFPALTETFITNKVLELHRRGHRITVIKNNNSGVINESHLKQVKDSRIEVLSIHKLSSLKNVLKVVSENPVVFASSFSISTKALKRDFKTNLQTELLNKHPYDIIHFEFSGLAISYLDALNKTKAKKVVSCRGTAEKVKPLSDPKRKGELLQLFKKVDAIHCVSDDMANTISPYCDDSNKVFINRPSIDASLFKRSTNYNQNQTIQILTVGRFTFQKGYLLGLLAIKELADKGHLFRWNIVGDGPQHEEMMYHLHAMGLKDHVVLLGKKNRDEVLELYNQTNIFFLPSVYEGIANVCLEAMSMELPVVSTKSGGMEEVIVDGENGLLCGVYNIKDMVDQLEKLITDQDACIQMGENARKTILENFTLQRQVDVFESEYLRLVNSTN